MGSAVSIAVMVLLALAAGAWMTRPLWRGQVEGGQRRRAANVAAYRQRLNELDADRGAGLLDADTAMGLRKEMDDRLVQDAEAAETELAPRARTPLLAALIFVSVCALAVAGYVFDGSWKVQQQVAGGADAAEPAGHAAPGSVEDMVAKLTERLAKEPDDMNGWAMLGRSLFVLERYPEAAKAYARANELSNRQEPDLLVNEGEALALARDRDLLGVPAALFEAAVVLAPQHAKALWYSGLAAEQGGDFAKAQMRWTELSRQELPEPLKPVLKERLAEVAAKLGEMPGAAAQAPASSASAPAAPAAPAVAAAPAAAPAGSPTAAATVAGPVIQLAVSLRPDLAAKLVPEATLFVFAKAASGPPMPLAVYRGKASELPRTVRLDDSMAMMPALKLSSFEQWTVTARVSRGGGVTASSGDLQGSLTVARKDLGDAALALVIDQVVP